MARKALNVLVGASLKPLEKQLKKGVRLVKDFGKSAGRALAGTGGIGGAIAGAIGGVSVAAALKMSVSRFAEVEKSSARLEGALRAGGRSAEAETGKVLGFAKQMQATTGIAVSSTMAAAAQLAQVDNIQGPNFEEAIKQAANYAAVVGGDVTTASGTLASALKNPREGYLELAAAGVRFSDAQIDALQSMQAAGDMAGAQGVILDALRAQYDGAAEAAGNTLAGSVDKLWGSVNNLAVSIGEALAPYLQHAIDLMTSWAASLDTAGTKNAILDQTAQSVGVIADSLQVMGAVWNGAKIAADAFIWGTAKGLEHLLKGLRWVGESIAGIMEKFGIASDGSERMFDTWIRELEEFGAGIEEVTAKNVDEFQTKLNRPWESKTTDGYFAKIQAETKKTNLAASSLGESIRKGPVEGMKQLSSEAIEAQKSATSMVKDLQMQLDTFGLSEFEAKARQLERKGATGGQVDEVRKLGAKLEGKQLAESLETPFEAFRREMTKLEGLFAEGGISGDVFARAQTKLVGDLQSALPDQKFSAGGTLKAGSQEARSALLAYQNLSRQNDPATQQLRIQEKMAEDQKLATIYLRKLADARQPQLAAVTF